MDDDDSDTAFTFVGATDGTRKRHIGNILHKKNEMSSELTKHTTISQTCNELECLKGTNMLKHLDSKKPTSTALES